MDIKKVVIGGIVAVVVIIVGIFAVVGIVNRQNDVAEIMKSGVNITAVPVQVDTKTETRKTGTGNNKRTVRETKYVAVFSYTVDGKTYNVQSQKFNTQSEADNFLNTPQEIRYLEKSPEKNVLLD
jgi:hypothetical protein